MHRKTKPLNSVNYSYPSYFEPAGSLNEGRALAPSRDYKSISGCRQTFSQAQCFSEVHIKVFPSPKRDYVCNTNITFVHYEPNYAMK